MPVTCDRSTCTPVSFINETDHHDITEILLKMALNTINQPTKQPNINKNIDHFHHNRRTWKWPRNMGLLQKCGRICWTSDPLRQYRYKALKKRLSVFIYYSFMVHCKNVYSKLEILNFHIFGRYLNCLP